VSEELAHGKIHVHGRDLRQRFSFIVVASIVCVIIAMYKFGESVDSSSVEDT